ncbi:DUF2550 family protein [Nakamurella antarctica]|uniref:DUF2550 family protein n=1 Tax=Nakamurella antarctica TaxID=1902245 RepID=A0A3G8ZLE4_9ACTN|nr:DUF2550 domain-containing protein [Nakamurella antarctica]AZI58149.1 DUF2550 family protein [Nakamurella antarctica]
MHSLEIGGLSLLILAVLVIVFIAIRRFTLSRAGAIDMCWRNSLDADSKGWYLGLAKFDDSDLLLYRSFSPFPIASRILRRGELMLGERRSPAGTEADLLPIGAVIIRCTDSRGAFELAMSEQATTGVLSWIESLPPSNQPTSNKRSP